MTLDLLFENEVLGYNDGISKIIANNLSIITDTAIEMEVALIIVTMVDL